MRYNAFIDVLPGNHTLATCRGFWCSIPPCSLKPHGAPPDRVMITSSATMVRFVLASLNQFVGLGALSPCYFRAPLEKTTTTVPSSCSCKNTSAHGSPPTPWVGCWWWGHSHKEVKIEGKEKRYPPSPCAVQSRVGWRQKLVRHSCAVTHCWLKGRGRTLLI